MRRKYQRTENIWRQKQRTYIPREDASSPTVSTEYVILTSIVNTKENRDNSVIEILNEFIHMRVKKKKYMAIIKLRGVFVGILCNISSYYKAYVNRENRGVKHLMLCCHNAP